MLLFWWSKGFGFVFFNFDFILFIPLILSFRDGTVFLGGQVLQAGGNKQTPLSGAELQIYK